MQSYKSSPLNTCKQQLYYNDLAQLTAYCHVTQKHLVSLIESGKAP